MKETSYHHGNLRSALIEAGVEILSKEGTSGLSLRKAARQAGVSHAAPYRHFEDKDDLILAIGEDGFRRLADYLQTAVDENPDDPLAQLRESGWAYVRFGLDNPDHLKIMFASPTAERPMDDSNTFGILVGVIEHCQAAGLINEDDPVQMAFAAWSQVHGVAKLLINNRVPPVREGVLSAEEVARYCLTVLFNGLLKR